MRKQYENNLKKTFETKATLKVSDIDHAKAALLNGLSSPESKRGYRHSIDEFISWYCSEPRFSFSKHVVTRYRLYLKARRLAPRTHNGRRRRRCRHRRTTSPPHCRGSGG